jgi:hypothetical protein
MDLRVGVAIEGRAFPAILGQESQGCGRVCLLHLDQRYLRNWTDISKRY